MAIFKDPKDPQGLMRALGSGAMGMGSSEEKLIGDYYEDDYEESKASSKLTSSEGKKQLSIQNAIRAVEKISKTSNIDKNEIYKFLETLTLQIENNLKKLLTSTMDAINPSIRKDLIEVTRLLDTGSLTDQNKALQKIEDLQRKWNVDLRQYNITLGKNLDKLNNAVDKLARDREERIQLAKEKQAEELSKGRATSVSKEGNLKYLSKTEIAKKEIERKEIDKLIKIKETEFKKLYGEEGKNKSGAFSTTQQKNLSSLDKEIIQLKKQSGNITTEIGEKKPGFGSGAIGFLKGERGPDLLREFVGTFYSAVESILGTADKLLLNIPSTIGKKLLEKGLPPLFDSIKKAGIMFSDKFGEFTKKTLEVLGKALKPLTDKIKDSLSGIGKNLGFGVGGAGLGGGTAGKNLGGLVGKGPGSTVGGIGKSLGMMSLGGTVAGGTAAAGGTTAAGGALAAGKTAAAGGAAAAGGTAAAGGLGAVVAAAAPFILGGAIIAGLGYGLKKLYDKKKEEGTLGSSFDESTGEYIPGPEEYNKNKIMSSVESKKLDEINYKKGISNNVDLLKSESEKFTTGEKETPNNLAILNQNSPTTINKGESKTLITPTYINSEPTFNIINTNRVY